MSHFTEGVLQAYLDDEVAADARAQVHTHVSGCADCAGRLQDLRELSAGFATAMAGIAEESAAVGSLAQIRERASRQRWFERMGVTGRQLGRAAIIVLSIGVATVPGSPVRAWLIDTWRGLSGNKQAEAPAVQEQPAQPTPDGTTPVGTTAEPALGRVQIALQSSGGNTLIQVSIVDGEKATLEAFGAVTAPRLRSGPGYIVLTGGDANEVKVSLPREANATVEVNGRVYVTKDGGSLRFAGPGSAEQADGTVSFRTPK
jgi:hypothetical protein